MASPTSSSPPPEPAHESAWVVLRLARWLVPYRARVALALLSSLVSAACAVLVPVVLSRVIIDGLLLARTPADLAPDYGQRALSRWLADALGLTPLTAAGTLYLAWVLAWAGFAYVFRAQLARASQSALRDLRRDLLAHVQALPASYYDRVTVAEPLSRITGDVESLSELLVGLGMLLGELLPFALAAALMLTLDPVLLAELSPMTLLVAIVITVFRRFATPIYQQIRASLARLQEHLHESLSGMETVQLCAREPLSIARHRELNEQNRVLEARIIHGETIHNPLLESMGGLALGLLLWLGGRHVAAGATTLGSLVLFLQLTEMLFRPLMALGEQANQWLRAAAASRRIFHLLDLREALATPARPVALPARLRGAIELRDLRFRYGSGREVLRGIDLTLSPGETLGIVGATGSGKTTLSRLLCRLYDVAPGSVLLDGHDVMQLAIADVRRHVGVILQDFHIFPGTVHDNLALGDPRVGRSEARRAAALVQALSFIEALPQGFDTVLTGGGASLSQGQRQLLAFARAVALDPSVLILDEATASVDPETEAAIQRALGQLMASRTCLVIAHRLRTVRDADRIAVLEAGRVVELGRHDELLARGGAYRALYEAQDQGDGHAA